jgi:transcription elongation GreA/GreB family factor
MSVAFTREEDLESQAADLPDRPISPHPNLVTASGMAQIEQALSEAQAAYAAARGAGDISTDRTAMARATRALRYWSSRRSSARLAEPDAEPGKAKFGRTVEIEREDGRRLGQALADERALREDGRRQSFRIVGEDEADPAQGRISYVSPLARALLGAGVGDVVTAGGGQVEVMGVR